MISSSDRVRTVASSPVAEVGTIARLRLLQWAPIIAAMVLEPWAVVVTPLLLFHRHLRCRLAKSEGKPAGYEKTRHERSPVLAAATILLGICALIIVALKITDQNAKTWSDEAAWTAALFMLASIVLSRAGGRAPTERWRTGAACWSYLAGVAALLFSVLLAVSLLWKVLGGGAH